MSSNCKCKLFDGPDRTIAFGCGSGLALIVALALSHIIPFYGLIILLPLICYFAFAVISYRKRKKKLKILISQNKCFTRESAGKILGFYVCSNDSHSWNGCYCHCWKTKHEHEWIDSVCRECGTTKQEDENMRRDEELRDKIMMEEIYRKREEERLKCQIGEHDWEYLGSSHPYNNGNVVRSYKCRRCGVTKEEDYGWDDSW